jgi:hypothetical protein
MQTSNSMPDGDSQSETKMADNQKTTLTADKFGCTIDTSALAGKKLTDDQAHILVLQRFTEILDEFGCSISRLADALKDFRFR